MAGGIGTRGTNRLTDRTIRAWVGAGESAQPKKLSDGGGLFLTKTPSGTPVWRVKYRFGGKERLFAVGQLDQVGLKAAREVRERVKNQLQIGQDPVQARRLTRADGEASSVNTFETVAEQWLAKRREGWSEIHFKITKQALERDVFPRLAKLPIAEITPAMVANVIEEISSRGVVDTAHKVLWSVRGVFRLAQAKGLCRDNPAEPARELLPRKKQIGRRPALLTWPELGDVLRRANAARLTPAVRMAHRLCAFTAARMGNIVAAEWSEFDLDAKVPVWLIPRRKMKAQDRPHDHKVILGPSIAAELRAWRLLGTPSRFLFPTQGPSDALCITHESVEKAYRVTLALKDKHTPHGWRAALSTLARDFGGFDRDVVELALDHVHDNDVVRAYDRGERLEQRIRLATWWCDQLTKAERGEL